MIVEKHTTPTSHVLKDNPGKANRTNRTLTLRPRATPPEKSRILKNITTITEAIKKQGDKPTDSKNPDEGKTNTTTNTKLKPQTSVKEADKIIKKIPNQKNRFKKTEEDTEEQPIHRESCDIQDEKDTETRDEEAEQPTELPKPISWIAHALTHIEAGTNMNRPVRRRLTEEEVEGLRRITTKTITNCILANDQTEKTASICIFLMIPHLVAQARRCNQQATRQTLANIEALNEGEPPRKTQRKHSNGKESPENTYKKVNNRCKAGQPGSALRILENNIPRHEPTMEEWQPILEKLGVDLHGDKEEQSVERICDYIKYIDHKVLEDPQEIKRIASRYLSKPKEHTPVDFPQKQESDEGNKAFEKVIHTQRERDQEIETALKIHKLASGRCTKPNDTKLFITTKAKRWATSLHLKTDDNLPKIWETISNTLQNTKEKAHPEPKTETKACTAWFVNTELTVKRYLPWAIDIMCKHHRIGLKDVNRMESQGWLELAKPEWLASIKSQAKTRDQKGTRNGNKHRHGRSKPYIPKTLYGVEILWDDIMPLSDVEEKHRNTGTRIVNALRRERSASTSGWSEELIEQLFRHQSGCMLLSIWCEHLIRNHTLLDKLMTSAKVAPIEKPTGGYRPIAVLDVWRRLIDRWALYMDGTEAIKKLIPANQLGIGVRDGCHIAYKTAKIFSTKLKEDGHKPAILSLDAANAFGSMTTEAISSAYNQLEETCPNIAQVILKYNIEYAPGYWITPKGGRPTNYQARRGVPQGSPISPIIYCLACKPIYDRINKMENCMMISYIDDCSIVCPIEKCEEVYKIIAEELEQSVGPKLNSQKTEIFLTVDTPGFYDTIPTFVTEHQKDNIKMLGARFGETIDTEDGTHQLLRHLKDTLTTLKEFTKNSRAYLGAKSCGRWSAFQMIRSCVIPRVMHYLRIHPPHQTEYLRKQFQSQIIQTISEVFEIKENNMIQRQLELPLRLGRAGLFNPSPDMANSIYASAWMQTLPKVQDYLENNAGMDRMESTNALHTDKTISTIQELYEPMRNRLIENFNIDKKNDKFNGSEEISISEQWHLFTWPMIKSEPQGGEEQQPNEEDNTLLTEYIQESQRDTGTTQEPQEEKKEERNFPGDPTKVQALFTTQLHRENSRNLKTTPWIKARLDTHEGSEAAAPYVVIHGLEELNVPDDAFKGISKIRFEKFNLIPSSTCANVNRKSNKGRCGTLLGNHISNHVQTCKAGGWDIKIHDSVRDGIARPLRYTEVQTICETQTPTRDGKRLVQADIVVVRADNSRINIEVETHTGKSDQNVEERQVERDKERSKISYSLVQYGYSKQEAKHISGKKERPETVLPVVLSSTGQIEERSKQWLRQLLTELCPAPILKGKVRDPLWNANRFLRRIALSATILSAGRVLSSLGIPHNLQAWNRF